VVWQGSLLSLIKICQFLKFGIIKEAETNFFLIIEK
jgi:hypothetical protein